MIRPDEAVARWYNHWIGEGFQALEGLLSKSRHTGRFCHGDTVSIADVCLVPQVVSAQRWATDLTPYPTVRRIFDACLELDAFVRAMPANQPDAQ